MMATEAPARVESRLRRGMVLGGKYALKRCMAVGGMGEIWLAKNKMTRANVALKVLRPDVDAQLEAVPRFHQEARLGAMLSHRNIVRVFDLLEEPDGALILVMELLHGGTLADLLEEKKQLDTAEAVAIALPILSALDHAHENGVVHRDLKPENVFLAVDPDGHVVPKLLDFGIAKIPELGTKTLDGRVLGTPQYMSPEQIRAEPKIDGRSDIFGMAVLILKMLTGASPFAASTPSASLAAVLETDVDPDPVVDPRIWLVLKRALAKRAYERHNRASELATELRRATGLSETELANALQRDQLPESRRRGMTDRPSTVPVPEGSSPSTPDLGPAAVEVKSGTRSGLSSEPDGIPRSSGRYVILAAVGVATLLVLGAVALWPGSRRVEHGPETTATAAAPSADPIPSATASALELPANDPVPVASASAALPTPKPATPTRHTAPAHTTKPRGGDTHKPVATTPGF